MPHRPALGKRPSSNDRGVSPPPTKRKQQSTTTSGSIHQVVQNSKLNTARQSCRKFFHPGIKEGAGEDVMADC